MLKIDFNNIEELIFQNEEIQRLFPHYCVNYFQQWKMGKQFPFLQSLVKKSILDFLNELEQYVDILENYFQEKIIIEKINYNMVLHTKIPLNNLDLCSSLCKINDFNYFTTWRDEDYLYLSFWR